MQNNYRSYYDVNNSFCNTLVEIVDQYKRQLLSAQQSGGLSQELEVTIFTCRSEHSVQKQINSALFSLNTSLIKRLQVVCLCGDGTSKDQQDDMMTSPSSDHSDQSTTVMDIITIQPDHFLLQNFFSSWLTDLTTDNEHMHLLLSPGQHCNLPMVIKCDLYERILQPAQLPFYSQFTLHPDSGTMKMTFPTMSKAMGITIPVYKLQVVSRVPISSVCDSIVYGMPMIAQATSCWKIDWDDLEKNQQLFTALCHNLLEKGQALVTRLNPSLPNAKTSRAGSQPHLSPHGHFVLVPSENGTLLVKSVAVRELMLPYKAGNRTEEVLPESAEMVSAVLDQVEELDCYNPLQNSSNLFDCLKALGKKSPKSRPTKKPVETGGNKGVTKVGKQLRKAPVVQTQPDDPPLQPLAKRQHNKMGTKGQRRTLYTEPHTLFTAQVDDAADDDDYEITNWNLNTGSHHQQNNKFPTSL